MHPQSSVTKYWLCSGPTHRDLCRVCRRFFRCNHFGDTDSMICLVSMQQAPHTVISAVPLQSRRQKRRRSRCEAIALHMSNVGYMCTYIKYHGVKIFKYKHKKHTNTEDRLRENMHACSGLLFSFSSLNVRCRACYIIILTVSSVQCCKFPNR